MPPKKIQSDLESFLKHAALGVALVMGLYAAIDNRLDRAEERIAKRVDKIESEIDTLQIYVYQKRKGK